MKKDIFCSGNANILYLSEKAAVRLCRSKCLLLNQGSLCWYRAWLCSASLHCVKASANPLLRSVYFWALTRSSLFSISLFSFFFPSLLHWVQASEVSACNTELLRCGLSTSAWSCLTKNELWWKGEFKSRLLVCHSQSRVSQVLLWSDRELEKGRQDSLQQERGSSVDWFLKLKKGGKNLICVHWDLVEPSET